MLNGLRVGTSTTRCTAQCPQPYDLTKERRFPTPFILFKRNKVNKKVGNLLNIVEVFLQKIFIRPASVC